MNILNKKFLLLTILTGLSFSCCNICVANINNKTNKSGSIFSSILNTAFFLAIVSVPFLIYAYNKDNFFGKAVAKSGSDTYDVKNIDKNNSSKPIDTVESEFNLEPYIKDCSSGGKNYKKIDNVEYMQLKTINQGNEEIISVIKPKYDSTIDENGAGDQNFSPGATCGSQALRNAYFLLRALSTKDVDDKKYMLKAMNDIGNAKKNIENSLDRGETTSWLENVDLSRRVSEITLQDGSGKKLSNGVTVIDTVTMVEAGAIDHIINQFRYMDNFYHVFIISTGDIYSLTGFDDFMDLVKIKLGKDLDKKEIADFRNCNSGGHWYTIAIEKNGESIKCMIVDTGGSPDLVTDAKIDIRARFLCEYIFNGFVTFNFRENMVDTVAHIFELRAEAKKKEQEAKLNKNKPVNNVVNNNRKINRRPPITGNRKKNGR